MREASYDLLLALGRSHPLLGMQAVFIGKIVGNGKKDSIIDITSSSGIGSGSGSGSVDVEDVCKHLWSLLLSGLTDPDTEGMDDHGDEEDKYEEEKRNEQIINDNGHYIDADMNIDIHDNDEDDNYYRKQHPTEQDIRDGTSGRIGIRRKIFNFFNEHLRFTGDPYERLEVLMTKLFEPSRTDNWLHYSSYLLLCLSKEDKKAYSKPLFDQQLATDCTFTAINLSGMADPGYHDTSSLPLFSLERTYSQYSDSQMQYQNDTGAYGTQTEDVNRHTGLIRGTQQISWTQTQTQNQNQNPPSFTVGAYSNKNGNRNKGGRERGRASQTQFRNPLSTQSLFSKGPRTEFLSQFQRNVTTQNPGSQLVSSMMNRSTNLSQNGQFGLMGPPTGLPSYFTGNQISTVIQRVPLRFRKGKVVNFQDSIQSSSSSSMIDEKSRNLSENESYKSRASSPFYSSANTRIARKEKEDKIKRNNKIMIYRQYKDGELPDICLPFKDLLRPLQVLCLKDSKISSLIFSNLFESLYIVLPLQSTVATNMRINMRKLLTNSKSNNTNFTATFLNISCKCLESENPRSPNNNGMIPQGRDLFVFFSTVDITEIAMKSLNFHAGIQYLESLLIVLSRINECVRTTQEKKKSNNEGKIGNKKELSSKNNNNNSNNTDNDNDNTLCTILDNRIIWQQISRLYGALGENDILLGLAERVSAYPKRTRKAVDAEVSGDFREAVKIYADLLALSEKK